VALELPARGRGLDAEAGELLLADALAGRALDQRAQALHQRRCSLERVAALAGAVAGALRLVRAREELDVLALGPARRAGGPAEDARAAHADEEQAVEVGVALEEGAPAARGRGARAHALELSTPERGARPFFGRRRPD
jgi:hypothetical protein